MEQPIVPFKIAAHGGAAGYAPENTLTSFQKGLELGANVLEVDVHLSKDGELIVMHDATLERTTDGSGYIHDHTLHDLKQLDAAAHIASSQKEQIPTLGDVFDLARGKAKFDIDLKNGPRIYPGIEEQVVRTIEDYDLVNDVMVISFTHLSLRQIKALNPHIQTGIVYNAGLLEPWVVAKTVNADALYPKYFYQIDDIILEAHRRGYPVYAWTIDTLDDMQRWINYGVDGITSNYPDLVRKVARDLSLV
ncbi:glycerophosphodiester phosphodiesterase [candidate division KSB3 bacterium]|uniref:Glycerophosphodiester phosphodiesterase n=1 Tax=candidate division KSB3 bacterium TaxID=2044937 RepID=A0A9D5JUB3_9BACT|nr:glycerophosphodiester phosphodiesterase [candidate division KSB3 bacterium]MBD3324290.1 glycerophosphodiester phosphodiesterase [candidate division KSB3 bacterium]